MNLIWYIWHSYTDAMIFINWNYLLDLKHIILVLALMQICFPAEVFLSDGRATITKACMNICAHIIYQWVSARKT